MFQGLYDFTAYGDNAAFADWVWLSAVTVIIRHSCWICKKIVIDTKKFQLVFPITIRSVTVNDMMLVGQETQDAMQC